ncbi:electron transfer flavoprotein subunit beta [Saccharospirillum sp.]|uniref:electron transfer flavoprotein subunit beta n=1 Tax=Saccharospirillum sp. TaxID=2033801 RepID=UPI0034A081B4
MLPESLSRARSGHPLKVAALVSVGQHPLSRRERRAEQDARALELALSLSSELPGLIHVGSAQSDALRSYLGMGLTEMTVLNAGPDADALPALIDHLRDQSLDIVLTGVRAECGEGSGLLPYALADRLGWPMVPRIVSVVSIADGYAEVWQALPRGQRRALRVPLPFVASVDPAAEPARQSAFGPAQRGNIDAWPCVAEPDQARAHWQQHPAKPRPKRLAVAKGGTAAERMKAATAKPQGQGGQVISEGTDREKAEAILVRLVAEGVVR